jgi:hypothetical protein
MILDQIPFEPDVPQLMKRLRVRPGSSSERELLSLLAEAQAIARPKAFYLQIPIETRSSDYVILSGRRFDSRVLAVNLEGAAQAYPFIATCGLELEEWARSIDDSLYQFWADAIKELALGPALQAFEAHLQSHFIPGHTATMSPGSLEDWPITQQSILFDLLGDTRQAIGVTLTESYLMLPTKSVSGIRFPLEATFESCQLCTREGCPGRRAPYDEALYERKYCPQEGKQLAGSIA